MMAKGSNTDLEERIEAVEIPSNLVDTIPVYEATPISGPLKDNVIDCCAGIDGQKLIMLTRDSLDFPRLVDSNQKDVVREGYQRDCIRSLGEATSISTGSGGKRIYVGFIDKDSKLNQGVILYDFARKPEDPHQSGRLAVVRPDFMGKCSNLDIQLNGNYVYCLWNEIKSPGNVGYTKISRTSENGFHSPGREILNMMRLEPGLRRISTDGEEIYFIHHNNENLYTILKPSLNSSDDVQNLAKFRSEDQITDYKIDRETKQHFVSTTSRLYVVRENELVPVTITNLKRTTNIQKFCMAVDTMYLCGQGMPVIRLEQIAQRP